MSSEDDIVASSFQDDPDANASGSGQGAVVTIGVAELEALIERLLDKKFAEFLGRGMPAPTADSEPPIAVASPEPAEDGDGPEWRSDPASMTIDDQVPPWEQTPEMVEVPMDTQASTVTIEGADELGEELEKGNNLAVAGEDGGGTSTIWAKVPVLPGGRASLRGLKDLAPSAAKVLVSIDGVSSVKGLRAFAPDVSDDEFTAIIEDGVGRGIVVFS